MSPIGGVGINLAIQDAVAAANALAPALRGSKLIDVALLREIQQRRLLPTRIIQALQVQAQKRLISKALEQSGEAPRVPGILRWLLGFRAVRNIPARLIGYGIRRESVRTGGNLP
jgi:2-polyprenyl-6-methoxyphenol hydroxylase-like FAD-dependent oxidoreductase